jgi:hypothetical protein
LHLRDSQYRAIVPECYYVAKAATHPTWDRAKTTADELARRYHEVFGISL